MEFRPLAADRTFAYGLGSNQRCSKEVSRYAKGTMEASSSGSCRSCQSVLGTSNPLPLLPPHIAHGLAGNEKTILQAARPVGTVGVSQQNAFGRECRAIGQPCVVITYCA